MKRPILTLLAAALAIAAPRLHAQMLLNGSFENPAIGDNGTGYINGSGDNWNPTGTVYVFSNARNEGSTSYGSQWLSLAPAATDTQTLTGTLTLGRTYTLSVAATTAAPNSANDQLTLSVSGAATASQTFAIPSRTDAQDGPLTFMTYSLSFTPTATGNVTVTLAAANTGFNQNLPVAIDNVQVVPEPSTWALLAVGIAALGLALRHRRHTAPRA